MKYCGKCGTANESEMSFCSECGSRLTTTAHTPPTYTPPTYTPPTYTPPTYTPPTYTPSDTGKGMSIAGLVLGIVGCALCWLGILNLLILPLSVVGIIMAVKGSKKAKETGAPTGIATAGLVLSIIGTSLSGLAFVTCTCPILLGGCALSAMV